MNPPDPVLSRQRSMIAKIIADETWLEGERRGRPVDPTDPVVRNQVCTIVLRIGAELRERAMRDLQSGGPMPEQMR